MHCEVIAPGIAVKTCLMLTIPSEKVSLLNLPARLTADRLGRLLEIHSWWKSAICSVQGVSWQPALAFIAGGLWRKGPFASEQNVNWTPRQILSHFRGWALSVECGDRPRPLRARHLVSESCFQ